eukprot:5814093-Prymnesium_polylepis.1
MLHLLGPGVDGTHRRSLSRRVVSQFQLFNSHGAGGHVGARLFTPWCTHSIGPLSHVPSVPQ